jgi:hypothetical protein
MAAAHGAEPASAGPVTCCTGTDAIALRPPLKIDLHLVVRGRSTAGDMWTVLLDPRCL